MSTWRMLWFHVRQFAANGYFVQLLITTTLGMVALQALATRAPEVAHGVSAGGGAGSGWLRAGMLGTWTVCVVSSGMLGYQRYQGTLVHLVRTPHRAIQTLGPVLGAASVFGLLALPLAAVASWVLRQPVQIGNLGLTIVAIAVFWVACLALSAFIGMLFMLTPNAITYEGLLTVPLVLVSGVFGTPAYLPSALLAFARLLPTRSAVLLLQQVTLGVSVPGGAVDGLAVVAHSSASSRLIVESLAVSLLWFIATVVAANLVTRRATVAGTLEVV